MILRWRRGNDDDDDDDYDDGDKYDDDVDDDDDDGAIYNARLPVWYFNQTEYFCRQKNSMYLIKKIDVSEISTYSRTKSASPFHQHLFCA